MMENTVIPLLIERMGGIKVTRVHVLRTCAVGESNVDRGIGDLMTAGNPTVGLAAHVGQTDVRITAKADTEERSRYARRRDGRTTPRAVGRCRLWRGEGNSG